MMTGEISQLGSNYVVTLTAANCTTGDALAREQVQAETKEDVLNALGRAASTIRGKLGESLASIEKLDKPLMEATTSSLEALRAFSLAEKKRDTVSEIEAIPLYQRALELDPNFAIAYGRLGSIYGNLGELELAIVHRKKAFALRERVTERERFYVTTWYYSGVTGERDKAIQQFRLWIETYPRHDTPLNNLVVLYNTSGQYEKALEPAQENLRLGSHMFYAYGVLARSYIGLNRFDEAKAVLERQLAQGIESWGAHYQIFQIAFIEGDAAAMQRHIEWAAGDPAEHEMLNLRADTSAFSGKLNEARELRRQAVRHAQQGNFKEPAGYYRASQAALEAVLGNRDRARDGANAALDISRGLEPQIVAAMALTLSGEARRARELADDLAERYSTWTLVQARDLPNIYAGIELERSNPA